MAAHAYLRKRDAQAWARKEVVKFSYFCNSFRSLFRGKTILDTLKNELNLSKEDLEDYAAKIKAAQGQDEWLAAEVREAAWMAAAEVESWRAAAQWREEQWQRCMDSWVSWEEECRRRRA